MEKKEKKSRKRLFEKKKKVHSLGAQVSKCVHPTAKLFTLGAQFSINKKMNYE